MALLEDYRQALRVEPASAASKQPSTGQNGSNKESGHRSELIDLTETERPGGEHPSITQTSHFKRPRTGDGRYDSYGLRLIRKEDKEGRNIGNELLIASPFLQKLLRSMLTDYAFLNLEADPIVIPKPYAPLFHHRQELQACRDLLDEDSEEWKHLTALTDGFLKVYTAESEKVFQGEIQNGKVQYSYLWTLFRGEDDVLVDHHHFQQIQRIVHYEYKEGDHPAFELHTWRWGYSAGKFGPCVEKIRIPKYSAARSIHQLPCYPLRRLDQASQDEIRRQMIGRGKKWRDLIGPAHRQYHGSAWFAPAKDDPRQSQDLELRSTTGRIMLDDEIFVQSYGHLADELVGFHGYKLDVRKKRDQDDFLYDYYESIKPSKKLTFNHAQCFENDEDYLMTDDQALLCPARVKGFSLADKRCALFLVQHVEVISFHESAFDSLCMQPRLKETIRALVETHVSGDDEFDDIISGKGKSMVIALEGPPGSGKTLTAEGMAELTQRPLYSVSTGDLDTYARTAEINLRQVFYRAKRWNAIVLLDEAELFLIKRDLKDLNRNALVTVFLRTMEYFQGVMFLTTNLKQVFDPAFDSRIHLHVRYDEPDELTRQSIWRNFLPSDTDPALPATLSRDLKINGREIKNLVRTALLISRYRKQQICEDIIKEVYQLNFERFNTEGQDANKT